MRTNALLIVAALYAASLGTACHTAKRADRYSYLRPSTDSTGAAAVPSAPVAEPAKPAGSLSAKEVNKVIAHAEKYIGTPYRPGGTNTSGMDCSGLVYTSFQAIGRTMPRTTIQLKAQGKPVAEKNIRPGHLVFFSSDGKGKVNHVGLVTKVSPGRVEFIHATTSRGVRKDFLEDPWWSRRFEGAVAY